MLPYSYLELRFAWGQQSKSRCAATTMMEMCFLLGRTRPWDPWDGIPWDMSQAVLPEARSIRAAAWFLCVWCAPPCWGHLSCWSWEGREGLAVPRAGAVGLWLLLWAGQAAASGQEEKEKIRSRWESQTASRLWADLSEQELCIAQLFNWILGNTSSPKDLWSIGSDCPGKWWSYRPWRSLKDVDLDMLVGLAVLG